ncbi:acyltransferase family protein [Companilactobacillus allii]|uniref:acyltransferase family protein n=1 Tax=Companilactobacillus allii TaxID=1847728 RepID=UPI00338F9814
MLLPIIVSALFLIFKKFEDKYSKSFNRFIEFIAPLTYGVYLSHGIVIELVQQVLNPLNYLGVFGVSIIVCLVLVWALSNIPFVRRYFI